MHAFTQSHHYATTHYATTHYAAPDLTFGT